MSSNADAAAGWRMSDSPPACRHPSCPVRTDSKLHPAARSSETRKPRKILRAKFRQRGRYCREEFCRFAVRKIFEAFERENRARPLSKFDVCRVSLKGDGLVNATDSVEIQAGIAYLSVHKCLCHGDGRRGRQFRPTLRKLNSARKSRSL